MKKLFIVSLLFTIFYLIFAMRVSAQNCQPIYGGGLVCPEPQNILIDKSVLHPKLNAFVDNLGVNDPKYQANQIVNFKINVANTGRVQVPRLIVRDTLPQFINFVSGPGNFDQASKMLSFEVVNLNPNETRTFFVASKVVPNEQLPQDLGIICVVNQSTAAIIDSNTATSDNAQVCIERQIAIVTPIPQVLIPAKKLVEIPSITKTGLKIFPSQKVLETPSTGAEALSLLFFIPTGALGYYLRKKAGF